MNKLAGSPNPFGTVTAPAGLSRFSGGSVYGIPIFVSILLKTLIMMAAIYAVFNFVLAGLAYINGAGDPKRIQGASEKIWQSVLGLAIAAGAFVIAGVVGQLLFKNPNAILNITLFTPQ